MGRKKYIGMDVYKESISIAVMEWVIETTASMILQGIEGLRGDCRSPLKKELRPPGCRPPETAGDEIGGVRSAKECFHEEADQSDESDTRRLAEVLRLNHLHPVYHGEHGLRTRTFRLVATMI
jgi:hypothetical protein